ncbi:MAG: NAD(+) synthase [Paludibacter sp.]
MKANKKPFSADILRIDDIESFCNTIVEKLRADVFHQLNRKGAIVGISGGIDSSVSLALTVRALGAENVLGVMMPETDSSPESEEFARKLAEKFAVKTLLEDITPALEGFNCYKRRDEAISNVISDFNPEADKAKIVIKQKIDQNIPPIFSVTVITPDKQEKNKLLPVKDYLQIVASSNFKQRCRMSMLYYHAERLHYAVIGTPNKHEVEQGFFVKYGDGGADVMPIAGLYKTQVYQLAEYLGIPQEIIERTPTTDTYSAEQTQEEFFYQLPYKVMDLIWYGWENNYQPDEVALSLGKSDDEINNTYKNFERKRKTTEYLRRSPIFY